MVNLPTSRKDINYTLFGLILGDGYYIKKYGKIRTSHTNKQRDYVEWLEKLCKKFHLRHSVTYDRHQKTNFSEKNSLYSYISIWVLDKRHFNKFGRIYNSNKKIVSKYVLRRITPFGLLLWYLDDGSLNIKRQYKLNGTYSVKRQAYLSTEGFSLEDNKKIKDMFSDRFNIDVRVHSYKKKDREHRYYRIYFNAENFRKFYDLLRPYLQYIPKIFEYKFNMKYTPNRHRNSVYLSENYNLNLSSQLK